MQEIKLWNVEGEKVSQITQSKLDYEDRLEKWLVEDISILSNSLAVIGSQVVTAYNKRIDILAINSIGEIIIIELKRDKTYREIVAQALDYATWVKDLNYDELNDIFNKNRKSKFNDLGEYFSEKFEKNSDEIEFNTDHKMLIVGSEIDDSTVRIIDYLSSEPYSVNINAVNFNYFRDKDGKEFLAQSFIKPEESIVEESRSKKRKRAKSIITQLFEADKLTVGQTVFFKPALEENIEKKLVEAVIVNKNQSCLKIADSDELFAFSKLRSVWADKFNLNEVRKNWGFGVRNDWVDENNKTLSDLLEE